MNIKKFIQTFHGSKMQWEIHNGLFYLVSSQLMLMAKAEYLTKAEMIFVKENASHAPGEVYALWKKHNEATLNNNVIAEETGLFFHVTTPKRELAVLKVYHEGTSPTAVLIREDFLSIVGKYRDCILYPGAKLPLTVTGDKCIAFVMPEMLTDASWSNLLDAATAICDTQKKAVTKC